MANQTSPLASAIVVRLIVAGARGVADDPAVFDVPAYRAATSTARRARTLATVTDRWRRVFTYHRTVEPRPAT